uniref:Uncharacterized protein n=1 Tax=Dulem virus 34 TaxID=3145752 RepID=A0AAU8B6Z3_9CAUD
MNMDLCKPCAMGLVAEGKNVKQVAGRFGKITCAQCGRRRYGVAYEVTDKKGATRK